MTETLIPLHKRLARVALLAACIATSACIYQPDIQQGNYLDQEKVEQVSVGMTRSQVEFLLGTPMIADPFHRQRWDYPYYLRRGRSDHIQRRWLVVHFQDDRVSLVELDRTLDPES
jgi:outer membrane protein assembly factor BamE